MIPSTLLSGYSQHYGDETENVQPVYITVPGQLDMVKKLYSLQDNNLLTMEDTARWVSAARTR